MNHFFDMDGTLTVYERWVYETDGSTPWYEKIRGMHYYRNCVPYPKMLNYIRTLLTRDRDSVYIITCVGIPDEGAYYEQVVDKILWIQEYLPELNPSHFLVLRSQIPIPNQMTKSMLAEKALGHTLTKQDFLYDDFNPNLNEWRDAGGAPIKVLNGINSRRKDMQCIEI